MQYEQQSMHEISCAGNPDLAVEAFALDPQRQARDTDPVIVPWECNSK